MQDSNLELKSEPSLQALWQQLDAQGVQIEHEVAKAALFKNYPHRQLLLEIGRHLPEKSQALIKKYSIEVKYGIGATRLLELNGKKMTKLELAIFLLGIKIMNRRNLMLLFSSQEKVAARNTSFAH